MKKIYTFALGLCLAMGASAQVTVAAGEDLQTAVNNATAGQTITITGDVTINSRLNIGKELTITAENGAKISLGANFNGSCILVTGTNEEKGNVTFNNVVLDGGSYKAVTGIEVNNSSIKAEFNNVTLQNMTLTGRGILNKKPVVLNNVSFVNCSTDVPNVLIGANGATFKGTGNYTAKVEQQYTTTAEGFTGKIDLTIENATARTIVAGGKLENFTWTSAPEFWQLQQGADGVKLANTKPVVRNQTTDKTYTTFVAAMEEVADGDVIVLLENVELTKRLTDLNTVTIQSEEGKVYTIKRVINNAAHLSFETNRGKTFTMKNVVFDQNNENVNDNINIFNFRNNGTFENVTIKNVGKCNSVIINPAGTTLTLNNVTLENCTATNVSAAGEVVLAGNTNMSLVSSETGKVSVAEGVTLTNTTPILVALPEAAYVADAVVVNGYTDASKFALPAEVTKFKLAAKDGNLVLADTTVTGVEGIEADENAEIEYFNLQGVRVANPENGVFIRRQGSKVSKVAL